MSVAAIDLTREHPVIRLVGFTHRVELFAGFEDYLDRDTQVAMLELNDRSALLDWEDVVALNRWSAFLIAERAAHEGGE